MAYKKCPKCDLNYIKDDEEFCLNCNNPAEHINSTYFGAKPRGRRAGSEKVFTFKRGVSPESTNKTRECKIYAGCEYIIATDEKNRCVGVVFEHLTGKPSQADGQAEICFFDKYYNEYGSWHRIFINGQRLPYNKLQSILDKQCELKYIGAISER